MYMRGFLVIIMFFNAQRFQYMYICFNPHTSLSCNVYTSSSLDIINYSKHMLDLGIYIYQMIVISNFILLTLIKHLTVWILRTFSSRNKLTMLTLFKALALSQLDYSSQLWFPN